MKDADTTAVVDIWKEKVFSLLLAEEKITPDVVESMRGWKHSGFSVDSSVCIEKADTDALRRVAQYIARSPMSLSRVVALTEDGSLIYRATHSHCLPFPLPADEELSAGSPRNFADFFSFRVFSRIHGAYSSILNKYQHMVHYYGYYSNKKRGLRLKKDTAAQASPHSEQEPLSDFRTQCSIRLAVLIKSVFDRTF
ncbi:MAG: transposase [Chitinivibrionales bacterium]|nr:transposase [Chitinivibrionales bacterium]